MKTEIKNYFGVVIYVGEATSLRELLTNAIRDRADLTRADLTRANLIGADLTRADLTRANLSGADLTRADLSGANFSRADLTRADLSGANFSGADLTRADLTRADLTRANLSGADLTRADLSGANFSGADLTRANLTGADLTRADLSGANLIRADLTRADLTRADLSGYKQDLIAEIIRVPDEMDGLRSAIVEGRIDGSTYSGECVCLAGTVANLRGIADYNGQDIPADGFEFHAASSSPREIWFAMIRKGDTPETNQASKLALDWIDEAIAIRDHIRARRAS